MKNPLLKYGPFGLMMSMGLASRMNHMRAKHETQRQIREEARGKPITPEEKARMKAVRLESDRKRRKLRRK